MVNPRRATLRRSITTCTAAILLSALTPFPLTSTAQHPQAALYQALLDATNGFTLMVVGAHPDDEDIEAVTYYRQKHGARVVVVIASRGEGGQNEIGPELYDDLAVIRSKEMRAAEKISGGEYYNLNFIDFGFSKHRSETYERWGQLEIQRRLIYMIRRLRPHVIITNHDSTSGHSNHQAVGTQLARAFYAAANPQAFPEQILQGLRPWQPLRLFWRVPPSQAADVVLEVGERHPFDGRTFARIAAAAMSQHRSQGMHFFAARIPDGPRQRRYRLSAAAMDSPALADTNDLFSGLENAWRAGDFMSAPAHAELEKLAQMRVPARISRSHLQSVACRFLLNLSAENSTLTIIN